MRRWWWLTCCFDRSELTLRHKCQPFPDSNWVQFALRGRRLAPLLYDWDGYRMRASFIGLSLGVLVVLVNLILKGFSLRGWDEFNLVIPYVRFVPHEVDVPLVVVDTSGLIDGRIARVFETDFRSAALVIPRFGLKQLQSVADSPDPIRQARERRGLEGLAELRDRRSVS